MSELKAAQLQAPFQPDLSMHAKALDGCWCVQDVGWIFPHTRAEALRTLCLLMWGVDGTTAGLADMVHLQVQVDQQDLRFPIWRCVLVRSAKLQDGDRRLLDHNPKRGGVPADEYTAHGGRVLSINAGRAWPIGRGCRVTGVVAGKA